MNFQNLQEITLFFSQISNAHKGYTLFKTLLYYNITFLTQTSITETRKKLCICN